MDKFIDFVTNHSNYFKKYFSIEDVESITKEGWLYIFTVSCYEGTVDEILPENTDKFGKTVQMILQRLKSYKKYIGMKNIEAIHCTLPNEREKLIKAYLKYKNINSVAGQEYFTNSRNLIKVLMLILIFITDDQIIKYEKYYCENNLEINSLFNSIDEYIEKIKEIKNFELKIEHENFQPKQKSNKDTKCEFCNKDFSSKFKLKSHLNICKEKEINEIKKEYDLKLENNKKEYELKLETSKKEYELKIENNIKEYDLKLSLLKKEHKKEIEGKNEYIKCLNNQINTFIEKTTSHLFTNNTPISSTNIKDEESNK